VSTAGLAVTGCGRERGAFPAREMKLVVQAAAGGLSDSVSRIIGSLMEKELGVPVVCENRPGAAGALAFSYVVRRAPDGYTIGHAPVEIAMVRTLGYADVSPQKMELLSLVSKTQPALAVQAGAAWKTLGVFADAVRRRPGHYVVANSGTGSIWHVNALLMERAAKMRLVHCPFSGSSGAITNLLGGHVDAAVAGVGELASHVRSGGLQVISVFDQTRSPLFPDVACVQEEGFDFGASAWSGFFGPLGLPEAVAARLSGAIQTAFASAEFQKLCEERGMTALYLDRAAFREFALEQAGFFESTLPALLRGAA